MYNLNESNEEMRTGHHLIYNYGPKENDQFQLDSHLGSSSQRHCKKWMFGHNYNDSGQKNQPKCKRICRY